MALIGVIEPPVTFLVLFWLAKKGVYCSYSLEVIEQPQNLFLPLSFRDRRFARFSLAMVFPTIFLGIAIGAKMLAVSPVMGTLVVILGFAAAGGFVYRRRHYNRRYHSFLAEIRAKSDGKSSS